MELAVAISLYVPQCVPLGSSRTRRTLLENFKNKKKSNALDADWVVTVVVVNAGSSRFEGRLTAKSPMICLNSWNIKLLTQRKWNGWTDEATIKKMSKNRIKHPVVVSNIVVFSHLKLGKMSTFWLGHIFQDGFCNLEMWPQENWIYQMDQPMYFHPQPVEPLSYSTWGFTVELGAQRSWNTHHWYNRMVSNLEVMMTWGGFPYLEKILP